MKSTTLYRRMFGYLKPHALLLLATVALSSVVVSLEGLSLWLSKPLVETLFMPDAPAPPKPDMSIRNAYGILKYHTYHALQRYDALTALKIVCVLAAFSFLIKNVIAYGKHLLVVRINLNVERSLRDTLYGHALRLPVTYYDRNRSGNVLSLVVRDVGVINQSMTSTLDKLVLEPFRVVFFVVMLCAISLKLTLLVFFVFPVLALLTSVIGRAIRRRSRRMLETFSGLITVLNETVGGIRTVKMFGMEQTEEDRFRSESGLYVQRAFRASAVGHLGSPITEMLGVAVAAVLLWYGGNEVLSGGSLSPGDFMVFLVYVFSCFKPLKTLTGVHNALQAGFAAAERVFSLLDTPVEDVQTVRGGDLTAPELRSEISVEGVSFTYPGSSEQVLSDISFSVARGQVIALVGASGSGKSTVLDLLPRFYEVNGGTIRVDGVDTRSIALRRLRRFFGTVAQETVLFNDTVAANIAYGVEDAPEEQIIDCARAANAWEFIERMPQGLKTVVGERGVLLSGGQRQRLAIARALLRNPPVLILDEATSALDTESERLVQGAINTLIADRTAIVVAHRLSTIQHADQILVLDAGRIVERGTHAELVGAGGRYETLHRLQFAAV